MMRSAFLSARVPEQHADHHVVRRTRDVLAQQLVAEARQPLH